MNEHICGAEVELQRGYLTALLAPPTGLPAAEPGEIHDLLTCVLQAGHLGRHHGIARSLPMDCDGEVWACWDSGRQPAALIAVGDCTAVAPHDRDEACVLFNGHAGAHSWALADSNGDTVRARLDLVPPQPVAGAGVEATPVQPPLPKPCRHPRTENISERSTAPAASGSCTSDTYPRGSTGSIVPPRGTGERGSLVVLPFPGPVPVPGVLGTGVPGEGYPFPWSVRGWIDGENAAPERIADMGRFAAGVGEFLTALQRCDTDGGPRKGLVDVNMGVVEAVVAEHRGRG